MNVVIVLGYAAWIAITLFLAYLPIANVQFLNAFDTQSKGLWAAMITLSITIIAVSITGLILLS